MKKIYIDFSKDIFDTFKTRTELASRSADPGAARQIIATDDDKDITALFFTEFVSEFRNETGIYDRLKDYDGFIIYEVDEETEKNIEMLAPTLKQSIVEYLLMRWYDSIGLAQKSVTRRAVYIKILRDWKVNSTRKHFVRPTYTPYF